MSGKYYQTYGVYRMKDKPYAKLRSGKPRCGVIHIAVPPHLEQKIQRISGAVHLPNEVIAIQAIKGGVGAINIISVNN